MDDFAFKKRNNSGTLIVNQETKKPVAILEGRSKEVVIGDRVASRTS
ncbi:hypothetical protein ACEOWJ_003374 [Bacillus cereus]